MKRGRTAYEESNDERLGKVHEFIKGLHFSVPLHRLREPKERTACPTCHKRRLLYCYDCLTVLHPECHPAPLALPINVHVILHPGELRGKSTSLPASTISPDLHILEYPTVPEGLDPATTLVLYPSAESVELDEIDHLENYKDVMFVDSTWQQSKGIARDERITKFKHVRIKSQVSLFWRFQNNDPSYLATVEAIYYFLREYTVQLSKAKLIAAEKKDDDVVAVVVAEKQEGGGGDSAAASDDDSAHYHGEVDDLLFYYINQYIQVQQRYNEKSGGATGEKKLQYTARHFGDYILESEVWDRLVAPPLPVAEGEGKAVDHDGGAVERKKKEE